MRAVPVALVILMLIVGGGSDPLHATTLDTHTVLLDSNEKLLSWAQPQDQAYGRVAFLSWKHLESQIPIDTTNGLPVTFTHSEYRPTDLSGTNWPNNPAGKNAMLADAAVMYYAYSADTGVVGLVRRLLDHQLALGTTPSGFDWPRVPWSTAAAGSIAYGNDSNVEGVGVLEPDKVGELGYHGYLRFYELTGDTRYRDAAVDCADALASHVRTGNATQSPWPFRVDADDNTVREDYCADVIAPIRLFDELIRLGLGNVAAYQSARQTAWSWLMTYPMSNNVWVNYFEDIPNQGNLNNLNQYDAGQTARYLLEHPETDPSWQAHANGILSWIVANFGGTDQGEAGVQFGAQVISEQFHYKYKMASHTARFGAINALYAEATGDTAAKERAFRSLNWSTYMCRNDGVTIEGPAELAANPPCWFTDGHGDYVRHFMLAMGAFPEWAPSGQNHLLRSSSVVPWVSYPPGTVAYRTFDSTAVEVLRMAWSPARVLANGVALAQRSDLAQPGWTFDPATAVLRIRHNAATEIQIDSVIVQHTLLVTTIGDGAVVKSPDQPRYDAGTLVTLTATPSVGWRFIGWSGDHISSGNPLVIELDADDVLIATFVDPSTLGREGDAPAEWSLSPVRPNPSRDGAAIEFALPQARAVRLSVIDLAGREVAVLADGTIPAGRHQARLWSGLHGLEPGLYFARLGMGERTLVQRFVITR